MDDIDRTLIRLLRDDARASISSLAEVCQVSRGTVQNRIGRMVNRGTIQGFTIRQPVEVRTGSVRAVMMMEVGGGPPAERGARLARHDRSGRGAHHQRPLGSGR